MKKNSDENELGPPFRAVMLSLLIIFVCAAAFCGCVSAEDVTNWETLNKSLGDPTVTEVTLTQDITAQDGDSSLSIYVNGTKTLDLAGHTINCSAIMAKSKDYYGVFNITNGSSLTIMSSNSQGKINSTSCKGENAVSVMFNISNGSLILKENVLLELNTSSKNGLMVLMRGSQEKSDNYRSYFELNQDAELKSNGKAALWIQEGIADRGGKHSPSYGVEAKICGKITNTGRRGIQINGGVEGFTLENLSEAPKITIGSTAEITATKLPSNNKECVGIFAGGYGNWVFEPGCIITGADAITIKSGSFVFNGGTFTANANNAEIDLSEDGENIMGTALRIVSVNDSGDSAKIYQGNVSIDIKGGTFTSEKNVAILYAKISDESHHHQLKKLTISGSPSIITHADKLYPINISSIDSKNASDISITIGGQTPFYPGLNTSSAYWANNSEGWWNVTLKKDINNVMSIDLSKVPGVNTNVVYGNYHFVKVVNDDKYSFDGWSKGAEKLPASNTIFAGGVEYIPIFTYIKQYDTGEEVEEEEEPTPTIEPTPIVTPTQNQTVTPTQNQTVTPTPTVKPTPEPKTVVVVETEVKFEDNKVITSITVPEGSSGSITFTQTEEKGMDEWIPESIEDSYSFDLSCDGEINGDSEIHFVMSDTILKSLGLTPDDVCLKHFENGVWVKLKISYIILDDGTYYYTAVTKSFSPFEISFDGKSDEPVTPTEETPQSPVPVLGILAGLCAAALLVRRK